MTPHKQARLGSNQECQYQKLVCYHYTTGLHHSTKRLAGDLRSMPDYRCVIRKKRGRAALVRQAQACPSIWHLGACEQAPVLRRVRCVEANAVTVGPTDKQPKCKAGVEEVKRVGGMLSQFVHKPG